MLSGRPQESLSVDADKRLIGQGPAYPPAQAARRFTWGEGFCALRQIAWSKQALQLRPLQWGADSHLNDVGSRSTLILCAPPFNTWTVRW